MIITNLEKNSNNLITKVVLTDGDLPTDTNTYAFNCFMYKWEDPYYYLYVNQTSDSTLTPIWKNEGIYELKTSIQQPIETEYLVNNSVVKTKISYIVLPVIVSPTATTGESEPNPTIMDGKILGYYPTGNQDQFVTKVEITPEAKVKITLAHEAIMPNTFNVIILKNQ